MESLMRSLSLLKIKALSLVVRALLGVIALKNRVPLLRGTRLLESLGRGLSKAISADINRLISRNLRVFETSAVLKQPKRKTTKASRKPSRKIAKRRTAKRKKQ